MYKILYDYQVFASQRFGGISRYFYELAKRVAEAEGFSATVVAPLHFNAYLQKGGVPINGIHVPRVSMADPVIRLIDKIVSPMLSGLRPPNIVHETYYSSHETIFRNCPKVVTVYDMIHERFPKLLNKSDLISTRKRKAVARADHVICISEHTRQDLVEIFDVPIEKTSTIHLGFSLVASNSKQSAPSTKRPFLLFVGLRAAHKNFDGLLRAYASSSILRRDFSLLAFGGGKFSNEEKNTIAELGLNGELVCHVEGDDNVLVELYRAATIFVYPSLYEGFGIPLLEAMSLDCPVVCGNASSIPEVVGEAAHIFDPKSIDSIRVELESVIGSRSRRDVLRELGRERIKKFSWDRCAQQTMSVYHQMVGD